MNRWSRARTRSCAGAVGGSALAFGLLALGALAQPGRAAAAYLVAYAFGASLVLGSLFWVMIQHLAGACWFVALRRTAERSFAALPLVALLFVPLLGGLPLLYPWVEPERIADPHVREAVQAKLAYLNPRFFALRALLYFSIWLCCGWLLRRWSLRQRAGIAPAEGRALARRQRVVSAIGLPASAFALNFAAVDWLMSLEPAWASSIFGVYVFAGSALAALALLILCSAFLQRIGQLSDVVRTAHYHALGKLLFTLLVFWAYVGFFQYFIIWIANIPEEVRWYVPRTLGHWSPLALLLALGHFALPFAALLSRQLKRQPAALAAVAGWLLAMHYLDLYWIVMPAVTGERGAPHWLDLCALIAVAGLLLGYAVARSGAEPEAAHGDPRFERALRFETP